MEPDRAFAAKRELGFPKTLLINKVLELATGLLNVFITPSE